jgi:hypothetical protein
LSMILWMKIKFLVKQIEFHLRCTRLL